MFSIGSGLTSETIKKRFSAPNTDILNIRLYLLALLMHQWCRLHEGADKNKMVLLRLSSVLF